MSGSKNKIAVTTLLSVLACSTGTSAANIDPKSSSYKSPQSTVAVNKAGFKNNLLNLPIGLKIALILGTTGLLAEGYNEVAGAISGKGLLTGKYSIVNHFRKNKGNEGENEEHKKENENENETKQNRKKIKLTNLGNLENEEMESDYDPDAVINSGYYEFTDIGIKKYVLSDLDNVSASGVNGDTLKNYLKELCEKFSENGYDYTKGWSTGDWDARYAQLCEGQAPWEYFFVPNKKLAHSGIWFRKNIGGDSIAMDDAHKELLAKEIILMHDHINDAGWEDVIRGCLAVMCTHGGMCAWRAASIVDNIYFALNQKAYEITGKNTPIFDIVFSKLKNIIINRSLVAMKKYMETKFNNKNINGDPLGHVNPVVDYLKLKLGISKKASRDNWVYDMYGVYINYADHGDKLLKKEMCSQRLFMLANRAMQEGVTEEQQNEAAPDVVLSFEEYCKYTMKSENSKQKLLKAVDELKKIDPGKIGAEEILSWIDGKSKLSVSEICMNLGTWAGCKIKGDSKEIFKYLYEIMPELKYLLGVRFVINCCKKDYLKPGHC